MKNLARIRWVIFSVVAGSTAGAGMMAGCSSDDSVVHPPPDASTDATTDTSTDSSTDSKPDTGLDAGLDSTTNFDVGAPQIQTWVQQVTRLYCMKAATCCGEATFDVEKCISGYMNPPGRGAVVNLSSLPFQDGGNMHIDPVKAQQCYNDINALSCGQTAATLRQTYDDCVAGGIGNFGLNATGCTGSPECAPQNHCDITADGGADGGPLGVCHPPRDLGATCDLGQFDYQGNGIPPATRFYEPQAQCGYLVTGRPRYCANPDTNVGWEGRDSGTSKCADPVPSGNPCYQDVECASNYCNFPATADIGTCSDSPLVGTEDLCRNSQKDLDAGDGGG